MNVCARNREVVDERMTKGFELHIQTVITKLHERLEGMKDVAQRQIETVMVRVDGLFNDKGLVSDSYCTRQSMGCTTFASKKPLNTP